VADIRIDAAGASDCGIIAMRQRAVNERLLEQPGGAQGDHAAGDAGKGASMLKQE